MKEPSVLDYVKSKLAFWSHTQIEIPPLEQEADKNALEGIDRYLDFSDSTMAGGESAGELTQGDALQEAPWKAPVPQEAALPLESAAAAEQTRAPARASASTVMYALGALAAALIAQAMLEPPNRAWLAAVFFYAFAAVMVGTAYYNHAIRPAAAPAQVASRDGLRPEGLVVNIYPLGIGLFFMAVTFLAFSTPPGKEVPEFAFLNTASWLLSIVFIAWAFYLPAGENFISRLGSRIAASFRRQAWQVHISRWTLLLLVVVGVVLFFRFYRLETLPNEAVSDQAEKLLDVYDVLNGELRVFFPRNTGREAFQFYWTALMVKVFHTGVTFFSLKLGTVLIGLLALYYVYRLGLETGNRWVALFALLFCGFSYWAQTQARIGLRFTLYPGFYAPLLFYLIRGLRRRSRNDFIWAGIWLGIGLHGYTSYRIVPFVVVAAFAMYILHHRAPETRRFALWGLVILALVSLAVFMPLFRFALERPDMVALRSLTRIGSAERELPGSPVLIFLQNSWNALTMFFWDDGEVWVHAVPHRPALDVISAALFFVGLVLLVMRYIRKRGWMDLFMLVSIPLLLLPSILSLAFPNENPNLNRTAAAYVPAFLIVAMGLEALLSALRRGLAGRMAVVVPSLLGLALALISARANFDLVFNQYDRALRLGTWDSTEMGAVVRQFDQTFGSYENAWVVAFPYWVDTRLVGINAGYPTRDMAIQPEELQLTRDIPGNKLFILSPDDSGDLALLQSLYPGGSYWLHDSPYPGKGFFIFMTLGPADATGPGAGVQLPDGSQ